MMCLKISGLQVVNKLGYTQFLEFLLIFLSLASWLYLRQDVGG